MRRRITQFRGRLQRDRPVRGTTPERRRPDPLIIAGALLAALAITWMLPHIKLALVIVSPPLELTVDQLSAERPSLPAYVRLSGDVRGELAYRATSTTDRQPRATRTFCRVPLTGSSWRSGDPVPVISSACTTEAGIQTVEGVLYPLVPRDGEPTPPEGIDQGGRIDLAALPFDYDGTKVYFLDARPPAVSLAQALAPLIIVGGVLLLGATLLAISWVNRRTAAREPVAHRSGVARRSGRDS